MVPSTRPAALDNISRICNRQVLVGRVFGVALLFSALSKLTKLFEFMRFGNTAPVAWEARTKYVCHQRNIVLNTNRALHTCCITKVFCSAHQVGMCITQLFSSNTTATKFIDQSAPCESVVNNATNCFTAVVGECELAQPSRRASKRIHCCER
jgi:hypothetical protein